MEQVTWKYVKKLNKKNIVDDFLKNNNIRIPSNLKDCLINNNGGRPSIKVFDTDKHKDCEFKALLSFNKSDKENIFMVYDLFMNTSKFPFGTDSAGNIICYDTKSNKYLFYNHEKNEFEIIKNLPFI